MLICVFVCLLVVADAAKILAVFPLPSVSHHNVFREFTKQLAKRGHEIVMITPFLDLEGQETQSNILEIEFNKTDNEINRKFQSLWKQRVLTKCSKDNFVKIRLKYGLQSFEALTEMILKNDDVRKIITDEVKFDLILLEGWVRPIRVFTYIFRAPVIIFSAHMAVLDEHHVIGSPIHPILYPIGIQQRIHRIHSTTPFEKLSELYSNFCVHNIHNRLENAENEMLTRNFRDSPTLFELNNNVGMLFLNVYPIWELNRPVPPSAIYGGAMHLKPANKLTQDLEKFMNASVQGVIYVSFGTNVDLSTLPIASIQTMVRALSALPYDVLWKWDEDVLPAPGANIKIAKWWPQAELLTHPKMKLFVTQGGLQSTDEAIAAGVPLIGIPLLGDQWYNAENYVKHKIGVKLDIDSITEDEFRDTVENILGDKSYRRNIERLGALLRDSPQSPMERLLWWTDHTLRHGAQHVRAPAHNMPWTEYLEIELLAIVLISIFIITIFIALIIFKISRFIWSKYVNFIKSTLIVPLSKQHK